MIRLFDYIKLEDYNEARMMNRKQKQVCPKCNKKTFVRYIYDSGYYVGQNFGKCDRLNKCGFHNAPKITDLDPYYIINTDLRNIVLKKLGLSKKDLKNKQIEPLKNIESIEQPKTKTNLIDSNFYKQSIINFKNSNFYKGIRNHFKYVDSSKIDSVFKKYKIGAYKDFVIFWRFKDSVVGNGKIIKYDVENIKRTSNIFWAHNVLRLDPLKYEFEKILFGEHLIDKYKTIFLVESEKSAVICSIFNDNENFEFIASGGVNNLNLTNIITLKDRCKRLIIIPDSDLYTKWFKIANHLYDVGIIDIRKYLNKSEIEAGFDIADLILYKNIDLERVIF